jgi:aspartate/methionine/tyrosine aminotransferase
MKVEPFLLERFFAEHEFSARHLLCASDCETLSLGELLALEPGAEEEFAALRLGYSESAGSPGLRQEIASLYEGIGADDVLVFTGAEEAIFVFMNAVLAAGDHVVVHVPCYQSLLSVAAAAGCRVSRWPAVAERGWALDPGDLAALAAGGTRAVAVNFPHNPTGYLPERKRFAAIAEFARDRGLVLFSDEVYRFLEHDPARRLPAACELYERGVSLGVMSKSFGLAGLRLGWVACRDRGILRAMAGMKDYTTICAAAPSEFLAGVALRRREALLGRCLGIVRSNLELLDSFLARHDDRFSWVRPQAGPVAFPMLRSAAASDDFCSRLLRGQGVLLAPGRLFQADPAHFRVGCGRADFAEGLAALERFLEGENPV